MNSGLFLGEPKKAMMSKTANSARPIPNRRRPTARDRPALAADGVDLTLIRWMLSLTPAERLRVLQRNIRSIIKLREKIST